MPDSSPHSEPPAKVADLFVDDATVIREALHSVHLCDEYGYVYAGPNPIALTSLERLVEQLEALTTVADSMSVLLADTIYQPKDYTGPEVWWAIKTRDLLARYDAVSNPAKRPT